MVKKEKPFKLDIACGQLCKEGWVGIDIVKCKGMKPNRDADGKITQKFKDSDIVHDLNKYPWPIKSNSVDEVFISHYIEHIALNLKSGEDGMIAFFNELYRIMKKGADCNIVGPYYTSMRCWQDPTHRRALSESMFLYYNKKWREENHLDHYPIKCDFDYSFGYSMVPDWNLKNDETKLFGIRHYNNVVMDIHAKLTKK